VNARLNVRPETEKTGRGREVPVSAHLVQFLDDWAPPPGRLFARAWTPEAMWINRCWRAAGVRTAIHGRHAFRRGFETGLLAAGVDLVRVRALIGHSSGVDDSYIDAAGLNLRAAVSAVPEIGRPRTAPSLSPSESAAQKVGHAGATNRGRFASFPDLSRPDAS
jgi:integrase